MRWILIILMGVIIGCGSDDSSTGPAPIVYPEGITVIWPTSEDTVIVYANWADTHYVAEAGCDSIFASIHVNIPGGAVSCRSRVQNTHLMEPINPSSNEFEIFLYKLYDFRVNDDIEEGVDVIQSRTFYVTAEAGDGSEWESLHHTLRYRYVIR